MTSQRSTAAAASGLRGLPNHGSMRTVRPPGVRTSTQAWPYQVIEVAPSLICDTSAEHRMHDRQPPLLAARLRPILLPQNAADPVAAPAVVAGHRGSQATPAR